MTESPWFPIAYQFVIGGAVFILGIVLSMRKGVISMKKKKDRRTVYQLVAGYAALFLFYAVMTILAGA